MSRSSLLALKRSKVTRRILTTGAISLLAIGAVVTAACRTPVDQKPGATGDARGTLRCPYNLAWGGKETLNPSAPTAFLDAVSLLFDRLTVLDANGLPVPGLALSWQSDQSASTWTFKLRPDVTFHNGEKLTAADVAYTIHQILSEKESPIAATLRLIGSVEVSDAQTVVFRLVQPDADFPILLSDYRVSILRENSLDTIDKTGNGTGPFKLKKLDVEGISLFEANDMYWRGRPGVSSIELIAIADPEARIQALLAGQIDLLMGVAPQQVPLFEHKPEFTVQDVPTGNWRGIVLRTDTPPFNAVRVRRALRIAADREQMLTLVLRGRGTVACDNPVWRDDPYHLDQQCPQNIELAKRLLAEAGFSNGVEVELYVANIDSYVIPLAEVYKQQVAKAGITVTIREVSADTYYTNTWMKVPMCVTLWAQKPAEQVLNDLFRTGSLWNESHWANSGFDNLLDQARKELNVDKRRALYQQAQALISEDGGVFIPFHLNKTRVYDSKIFGLELKRGTELYPEWHKITKAQ